MPISAALIVRVSFCVSSTSRSAPPATRPLAQSWYTAAISSKLMPPVIESDFVVGPRLPATKRGRAAVAYSSATLRERRAAASLISWTRSASANSASTIEPPPKVFVLMMSAPASR